MRPFKVRLEYADMQGASYKTLDECISRMEGNDRMETEGDFGQCELRLVLFGGDMLILRWSIF